MSMFQNDGDPKVNGFSKHENELYSTVNVLDVNIRHPSNNTLGSRDLGTSIYFKLIWIAEKILRSN
jgi:hypothetical protein